MTLAYYVGENLYLNITNNCSANCDFCVRRQNDGYGDAGNLWIPNEPGAQEVLDEIYKHDWQAAPEVVFCGFGEPTMRLEVMLEVAHTLKTSKPDVKLRLNTNGHGSMLAGRDITSELNIFDEVSVSLNFADKQQYLERCRPVIGESAYDGVLDFAAAVSRHVPKVTLTVISFLPPDEIALARKRAEDLGVNFRIREVIE